MRIRQPTGQGQWRRTLLTAAVSMAFGVTTANAGQCLEGQLRAPAGYYQVPEPDDGGEYDCERVAPHVGTLSFTSKYKGSDDARNVLNEEAQEEYKEATERIRSFEKAVIAAADDYQVDGDGRPALDCLMDNLDAWASEDSLLTDDINHVGQAVRKWALAAAANAYLRAELASPRGTLDSARSERIEHWFRQLSDGVRAYYTERDPDKVNNHDYWAAWAVMSSAVATQECGDWNWSLGKFNEAMGQVNADGYLPRELSRQTRALEYLNYAMQPLTMIATFAEVNGYPLHDDYREQFHTLAENVVEGLEDPQRIEERVGYEQITDGLYKSWSLAWMEPWVVMWDDIEGMSAFLDELRPMKSTRLGGDLSFLYQIDPMWPVQSRPNPPGDIKLQDS